MRCLDKAFKQREIIEAPIWIDRCSTKVPMLAFKFRGIACRESHCTDERKKKETCKKKFINSLIYYFVCNTLHENSAYTIAIFSILHHQVALKAFSNRYIVLGVVYYEISFNRPRSFFGLCCFHRPANTVFNLLLILGVNPSDTGLLPVKPRFLSRIGSYFL